MVRSIPLGTQQFPHPNAAEYEKIYSGDFVNTQRLLPPSGLSVLAKIRLEDSKEGSNRECLVDAKFHPDSGWKIFDDFFDFPYAISFSVIAWTWSPVSGKPSKFTTHINPIPVQF